MKQYLNIRFLVDIILILGLAIGFGYEFQQATQLSRRKEQWKSIIEHANFAFVTINQDGIIEMWSDGAEKLFGWRMEEIIGQNLSILFPENQYTKIHEKGFYNPILKERLKNGEILEACGELIDKYNNLLYVRVSIRAVTNGHICYVASITPEKNITRVK